MNKVFLIMAIAIMSITIIGTSVHVISEKENISASLMTQGEYNKKIKDAQIENENLKNNIEYQESKEFVEKVAREELGFVMKDEIIFKVK